MAVKATKDDVLKAIGEMSVVDLVSLVEAMEEKFGVSAAAPAAVAVAPVAAGDAVAAPAEEKAQVELVLASAGDKKVNVIKAVRAITGMGLKDSKDIVDSTPSTLKESMPREEAEEAKKQLEEAGATVELK